MKWQHLFLLGAALCSPAALTQCSSSSDSGADTNVNQTLDGYEMITPTGLFNDSDLISSTDTTATAPAFAKNWTYTEFDDTTFKAYRSDRSTMLAQGTYTWKPASSTTKAVVLHLDITSTMDITDDKGVRYTYTNVQLDASLPGISGSGLTLSGLCSFDVRRTADNTNQTTQQSCKFSNSNVTVQQIAPGSAPQG